MSAPTGLTENYRPELVTTKTWSDTPGVAFARARTGPKPRSRANSARLHGVRSQPADGRGAHAARDDGPWPVVHGARPAADERRWQALRVVRRQPQSSGDRRNHGDRGACGRRISPWRG